jgi:hypothetical protein
MLARQSQFKELILEEEEENDVFLDVEYGEQD